MKYLYYLAPLCLLISTYCYSQHYQILFFRKNAKYPPNLYYLSYMLATGHWETTYAKEFDSLVERNNGREYDPVLASTDDKKGSKEKR